MRNFIVLMSLLALSCVAQQPHPCSSPPLMTGAFTVSTQTEKMHKYGQYWYDALSQRMRVKEWGTLDNKTGTVDALMLYRERVGYMIDEAKQTCIKQDLTSDFHPMEVPQDASLIRQAVVGSSSGPGQGLLVNSWMGTQPETGNYMMTVTEFGCIPVSTIAKYAHFAEYGWVVVSYFDNVIGLTDPQQLDIPDFCQQVETHAEDGDKPAADFFSLFLNKN